MDAMSDAIEGAAVMLYGISKAYKESVNVRTHSPYPTRVILSVDSSFACVCERNRFPVPIGGKLRSSAGAGHDSADDAERVQTKWMYGDHLAVVYLRTILHDIRPHLLKAFCLCSAVARPIS